MLSFTLTRPMMTRIMGEMSSAVEASPPKSSMRPMYGVPRKAPMFRPARVMLDVYKRQVLICYGGGSAVRSGLLDRIKASLDAAGVEHDEFGGIQANPTVDFCAGMAGFARERGSDLLLAVGGGSVIDTAKMAAHCVRTGRNPWDYTVHLSLIHI